MHPAALWVVANAPSRGLQSRRPPGCHYSLVRIRIFDPFDLPLSDQIAGDDHPAVHSLREHAMWLEGMVWCSPERRGHAIGIMKAQNRSSPARDEGNAADAAADHSAIAIAGQGWLSLFLPIGPASSAKQVLAERSVD